MLRGAEILFSAIFAVTFLKRDLNKFHYCGIAGCLVGICMVGASSLLSPGGGGSSDTGMIMLGMALIVIAQVTAFYQPFRMTAMLKHYTECLPVLQPAVVTHQGEHLSMWLSSLASLRCA